MYCNSHGMLRDRVSALREANIYERHSYRHILGNPVILAERIVGGVAEADCEAPFMVARIMRTGETDLYATGRYIDTYNVGGGTVKIARRLVVLDSSRIDTLLAIPL